MVYDAVVYFILWTVIVICPHVVDDWHGEYAANSIAPCRDSCGEKVHNRMAEVGDTVNMTSKLGVYFHPDIYAKKHNINWKKRTAH